MDEREKRRRQRLRRQKMMRRRRRTVLVLFVIIVLIIIFAVRSCRKSPAPKDTTPSTNTTNRENTTTNNTPATIENLNFALGTNSYHVEELVVTYGEVNENDIDEQSVYTVKDIKVKDDILLYLVENLVSETVPEDDVEVPEDKYMEISLRNDAYLKVKDGATVSLNGSDRIYTPVYLYDKNPENNMSTLKNIYYTKSPIKDDIQKILKEGNITPSPNTLGN